MNSGKIREQSTGEASSGNFRSYPRSSLQLGQSEDFIMIHHTTFEDDLIPMSPNLSNHRDPQTSQDRVYRNVQRDQWEQPMTLLITRNTESTLTKQLYSKKKQMVNKLLF